MKIEEINNHEDKVIGEVESISANIEESSKAFLFEMMSKSLYSNPIGSIVREITSNCFDSHIEAGIDDPVIISRGNDDEGTYISFKDVGVGLSPDRVSKVFMNYFTSTKRESNDLIGGFGIGSKTPLAYTDHFYIITIFDKVRYVYILSSGQSGIPVLDLMDKSETIERNGTDIRIPIKNYNDETKFLHELKTQLCYFDNVYFQGWDIDNNYNIYKLNYFLYRNKDKYDKCAHIVLGKVSYPINWQEIEEPTFPIPIGIKFEIGELVVTPNRENLRYTEEVKALVKQRLILARNECIQIFESQNKVFDNYFEWLEVNNVRPHIEFKHINEVGNEVVDKLYLDNFGGVSKKHKCSLLEGLENIDVTKILDGLYSYVGEFNNRKNLKTYGVKFITSLTGPYGKSLVYIGESNVIREDFAYTFGSGNYYRPINVQTKCLKVLCRTCINNKKINDIQSYYFNLGVAVKFYKAITTIRKQALEYFNIDRPLTDVEKLAFKKYKDENNANLQRKLQGKVFVKDVRRGTSYDWKVGDIPDSKDGTGHGIDSFKGIVVYGFREDTLKLQEAITFLSQFKTVYISKETKHKNQSGQMKGLTNMIDISDRGSRVTHYLNIKACKVLQISQQNEKYFKDKPNMVHVDNLYGDNKLFRKLASSLKIENYFINIGQYQSSSGKEFANSIAKIYTPVGNNLKTLLKYYDETSNTDKIAGTQITRNQLKQEILDLATKLNLFDPLVEGIFAQVDSWFKGVEVIKYIDLTEESLPYILKLLVDNKKRLNTEYYQKAIELHKFPITKNKECKQFYLEFQDIEEVKDIPKLKLLTLNVA